MIRGEVSAFREPIVPLQFRVEDGRFFEVEAIVDTGFTEYLTLSRDEIEMLGLPYKTRRPITLGDNRTRKVSEFEGTVMWHGVARRVPVLASEQGAIIGMRLLQGAHLFVDALDGGAVTITPRPEDAVGPA